ncbi:hypothetical protein ACFWUZ_20805 [Streptomyces sp. NPDC058646]|uniref:hypothetical protein n=1 Tax=Streptomyces sp. NPDC058646 TaxID=3346574 RepID=UPI0036535FD6
MTGGGDVVERDQVGERSGTAGPVEQEVSHADSLPALVLLLPASLLVRYLGEHVWAYWTAVALGVLGVTAAGFGIAAAVGSLRRGRRRLLAAYTLVLLLGACSALAVRLFGD